MRPAAEAVFACILLTFAARLQFARGWTDAGQPLTWVSPSSPVFTTSAADAAGAVVDGDDATFWQSGACFPEAYRTRADLNALLFACNASSAAFVCQGSASDVRNACDGDRGSGVALPVDAASSTAWLQVTFPGALPLVSVGLRAWSVGENVSVSVRRVADPLLPQSWRVLGALSSSSNHAWVELWTGDAANEKYDAVRVESSSAFTLGELAANDVGCTQSATVDLGAVREVSFVETRFWPGSHATASSLRVSADGTNFVEVARLDPSALASIHVPVHSSSVRFVQVFHKVDLSAWAKVYVWEVQAFGPDGPFGTAPAAKHNSVPFSLLLGVNGIWGWGVQGIDNGTVGPRLYSQACGHARNYHNMGWDVTDPDHVPDYDAMAAGHGTEAQWWLNWDDEYEKWVNAGFEVDCSIQFLPSSQPVSAWDNPWEAGWGFGNAFARHFGPTNGTGHIAAMEVGNEPWDYPASFYSQVLSGMARGAKSGDPKMLVLPCALQALTPRSNHFIGDHINETDAPFIDALNTHSYSYMRNASGSRIAVHPEHELSSMHSLNAFVRWRDSNMPGTPIWLTEFGWDSESTSSVCTFGECVSERQQAIFGLRFLLIAGRLGIERATWFFYSDGGNSLYGRSGLTDSNFIPKLSWHSFKHFSQEFGGMCFHEMLQEDESLYVYALSSACSSSSAAPSSSLTIVVWVPEGGSDSDLSVVHTVAWKHDAQWASVPGSARWICHDSEEFGLPAASTPSGSEISATQVPLAFDVVPADTTSNSGGNGDDTDAAGSFAPGAALVWAIIFIAATLKV